MKNQIKTVLFDFDGTLADTMPVILDIAKQFAPEYGIKNIDVKTIRDKSVKELIQLFGIPLFKIPFIILKGQKLLHDRMNEVKAYKGMPEIVHELKENGYRLGILSSNSLENITLFLDNNDLSVFDFIYSEKNLFGKHRALGKIIEKEQLAKNTVIYIGDEVRDIEACKKVDLPIISVTWGFNSRDILEKNSPQYIIDRPSELNKYL